MKIILYFKKRSSFPPNKGGTMKFRKYVAWGIAILRVFFLSKYPEMRPIIPLLHFLSEAASVFQKYVCSICLSWFSSTTTYKFTKCLHLNDFETPKCEILSLTFEALSLPTKYIKLNFWMLQSLLWVKTGN